MFGRKEVFVKTSHAHSMNSLHVRRSVYDFFTKEIRRYGNQPIRKTQHIMNEWFICLNVFALVKCASSWNDKWQMILTFLRCLFTCSFDCVKWNDQSSTLPTIVSYITRLPSHLTLTSCICYTYDWKDRIEDGNVQLPAQESLWLKNDRFRMKHEHNKTRAITSNH